MRKARGEPSAAQACNLQELNIEEARIFHTNQQMPWSARCFPFPAASRDHRKHAVTHAVSRALHKHASRHAVGDVCGPARSHNRSCWWLLAVSRVGGSSNVLTAHTIAPAARRAARSLLLLPAVWAGARVGGSSSTYAGAQSLLLLAASCIQHLLRDACAHTIAPAARRAARSLLMLAARSHNRSWCWLLAASRVGGSSNVLVTSRCRRVIGRRQPQ